MWQAFKLWKLRAALRGSGNAGAAYSAVLELGRMGQGKPAELLISTLARRDGVSRSAARELGRLKDARAVGPLAAALAFAEVNQSAMEALVRFGPEAVNALVQALQSESAAARRLSAAALGEIGDGRAVQPLIEALAHDDDYEVRTAAAVALGQLKDKRAVWAFVATLKLRDETCPDRQKALGKLQRAAEQALRKIGDPLAAPSKSQSHTGAAGPEDTLEPSPVESDVHPRLSGDLGSLSEGELVNVLRELIAASEEISWANMERREPLLRPCFSTYEKRSQAAEMIGMELHRRGGIPLMEKVFAEELQSYAAIRNWWVGIGAWAQKSGPTKT